MNNLIDYKVSFENIEFEESSKEKSFRLKRLYLKIFSSFILIFIFVGSFYTYSAQKNSAHAIEFGLGNDYEEIYKLNNQIANNVPLSINSISTSSETGDKRVVALYIFLQKYNSPMATLSIAKAFVDSADANGFGDKWYILPAISGIESGFGKIIPYCEGKPTYNGWGWSGGSKCSRWSAFASWEDAAIKISAGLAKGYGATNFDPYHMMRSYCPPCALPSNNALWARTVTQYNNEMIAIYKSIS